MDAKVSNVIDQIAEGYTTVRLSEHMEKLASVDNELSALMDRISREHSDLTGVELADKIFEEVGEEMFVLHEQCWKNYKAVYDAIMPDPDEAANHFRSWRNRRHLEETLHVVKEYYAELDKKNSSNS